MGYQEVMFFLHTSPHTIVRLLQRRSFVARSKAKHTTPHQTGMNVSDNRLEDVETSENDASLLILILDMNYASWCQVREANKVKKQHRTDAMEIDEEDANEDEGEAEISLEKVVNSVLLFIDCFLLSHRDNSIAIIGCNPGGTSKFIMTSHPTETNSKKQPISKEIHKRVSSYLHQLSGDGENVAKPNAQMSFSASLAMAMCYCNSVLNPFDEMENSKDITALQQLKQITFPRILIVNASRDDSSKYTACINSAFAAQTSQIPIDCCDFSLDGSIVLQQLSHLTNGIFFHPDSIGSPKSASALTQYLMSIFLPDLHSRKLLKMPVQPPVALKAACFCHKKSVDRGYVCSVCLSVFCKFFAVCPTCNNKVISKVSAGRGKHR